jgi:hypothetical protein
MRSPATPYCAPFALSQTQVSEGSLSVSECVIFDIDGTLSDCSARRGHLMGEDKNWAGFNKDMGDDPPNAPVVRLARTLKAAGNAIVLCSGRKDQFRRLTEVWLACHDIPCDRLYMRETWDNRKDSIVKGELLSVILRDGFKPWLVVDDRSLVVKVWREAGLTCLQCAEGDF